MFSQRWNEISIIVFMALSSFFKPFCTWVSIFKGSQPRSGMLALVQKRAQVTISSWMKPRAYARLHEFFQSWQNSPCRSNLNHGSQPAAGKGKCQKVGKERESEKMYSQKQHWQGQQLVILWTVFKREPEIRSRHFWYVGENTWLHHWSGPHAVLIHVTNYMWSRAKSSQLPKWGIFQDQYSAKYL